jgi:hypothetical protein
MPEAIPLSCAGQAPTCTVTTLPNGSKLMLEETVSPDGSNLRTRQAHLVRADGLYISLISDNGKYWKDHGTQAQPPLSLAQLRAIVTSPRWQHKVDADLVDRSAQLFVPRTPPPMSTFHSRRLTHRRQRACIEHLFHSGGCGRQQAASRGDLDHVFGTEALSRTRPHPAKRVARGPTFPSLTVIERSLND